MTFGEQNNLKKKALNKWIMHLIEVLIFFDTAELYAVMPRKETYGKTEEIIGNWFEKRKNREKIILASKIASKSEDDLNWIREGSKNLGFDKKNMDLAIDNSLKRLQTDYIDFINFIGLREKYQNLVNLILNMIQMMMNGLQLKKY